MWRVRAQEFLRPLTWIVAYLILQALPLVALLLPLSAPSAFEFTSALPSWATNPAYLLFLPFPLVLLWPLRHQLKRPEFFAVLPSRDAARSAFATGVALLILCTGLFWLAFYPLSLWFPEATQRWLLRSPPTPGHLHPVLLVGQFLSVVVVTPFVEEVLFRGILFRRWAAAFGQVPGLLLSSATFASIHTDVLGAFAFAVVVSLLYAKSLNLYVPVLVHTLYNLGAVVVHDSFLLTGRYPTDLTFLADFSPFFVPALIVGGFWVLRIVRQLWPPEVIAAA